MAYKPIKRAAASQGHSYYVLTTTQLVPTCYSCIAYCVHHGNIMGSPHQYIHVYGHHGNIHVCVHFLHSPWQHTCGTASSNVIRYRWVADEPRILCCVHQTISLWLHMCHCLYGANSYATILHHMQVIITMATHTSILYGASCMYLC